ncbi:MAG TPA: HAD hydrolase family protein [Pseudonocardiaceae bacterium]|nr:HAD hydrolase family protein [Pseudonocardiaceae bacterium]
MIIVCDLDGTLSDASGSISAANAGALRWARERGATCVLATSRPSRCLDLPMEQRALFDCIITCDGAEQVVPEPAGVHLPLPPSAAHRARRTLRDAHIAGTYAVEFGTGLGHEHGYLGWPATDIGVTARVGSLQELCGLGPMARIFFRPRTQDALFAATACLTDESISVTIMRETQSAGLVQLCSRSATKGNAVRAWLAGTGRSRRLVVFGDQLNDLSMLELADDAMVVGNADPSLRRRFTHLPNDDFAAVARAIRQIPEGLLPTYGP